jgi:hypothetical protein
MTFSNLINTTLPAYLERGYVTDTQVFAQLPSLINLAERALATKLKIQGFLANVVSTPPSGGLSTGVSVYPKPNRWRETVSMNYGTGANGSTRNPLFARSYDYCRSYWTDPSVTDPAQPPLYYADYNFNNWLIVPTPPANYPWEINYYEQPPLLDATNQTNWLTNYAPNLLLYRILIECKPFLKDDNQFQEWMALYQEQLADVDTQDLQKVVDRESVREKA